MMYGWDGTMPGWGWLLMLAGNLVVLGLLVAMLLVVGRLARARPGGSGPTPHELLADRFARGEIDEAEYRRRTDVLNGAAAHGAGPPAG